MTRGLLTTAVGSYPKPEYVLRARARVARGEVSPKEMEELEKRATAHWIRIQEELGMDILVDGEMYRGDMVAYFAENWEGFTTSGLVRSYGNRYYRKPVAVGPVGRSRPTTLEWWRYAQSLTPRPVKGMLTGPYTIVDWSFNEYYPTREAFLMEVARAVHDEAVDLAKAGAEYIQIDEPAISTRPEEMEMAARALAVVTRGLEAFTITHVCYGDFAAVFPQLAALPVDMLDLETANSNYNLLDLIRQHSFGKCLSMGVVDVHHHETESVEQVKEGIRKGLEVLSPERLYIDPDCGLKTRTEEESVAKLRVMVAAVREVKEELGIE
ncbi:MAG: methionine synthase [Dehalococcoidia bacterium]|nr:methionine synthase [Dehalococcoidia bacterium]